MKIPIAIITLSLLLISSTTVAQQEDCPLDRLNNVYIDADEPWQPDGLVEPPPEAVSEGIPHEVLQPGMDPEKIDPILVMPPLEVFPRGISYGVGADPEALNPSQHMTAVDFVTGEETYSRQSGGSGEAGYH